MTSHIMFAYDGKDCGIDPLSKNSIDIWCGDNQINVDSVEKAMEYPLFCGKSLSEIADVITDIEW